MLDKLPAYNRDLYRGMSYGSASWQAQRVCEIAGRTGQTDLAFEHLSDLVGIMRGASPLTPADAGRALPVGAALVPCHWLPLAPGRFVDAVVTGTDGRHYLALPWASPVEYQVKSLIASRLARQYRRDDVRKAIERLQAYVETLPVLTPNDKDGTDADPHD
ncbi:hypothetical protein NS226_06700 [Aureimonas ureilytica]|uniref:Uncharacterized protein n=1 Tax=Aureimonas ureilytica TaxID=401562 RepID=A0A175RCQ4_9HYPH|nr:hypothetical protein [Aureimonas ureilytica]KTQ96800.1 hypothetical protein NS226_06700 [Aureimonas ureilytica]